MIHFVIKNKIANNANYKIAKYVWIHKYAYSAKSMRDIIKFVMLMIKIVVQLKIANHVTWKIVKIANFKKFVQIVF